MNADIMSTIDLIEQQTSSDAILQAIRNVVMPYGVEHFIISGLPDPRTRLQSAVLLSHIPSEWFERYISENYVVDDPVARRCFATSEPFAWSEAPYDEQHEPRSHRIMQEARSFGLAEGFCVPMHLEGGALGGVSFSGQSLRLDPRARRELHMLAFYAYSRLRAIQLDRPRPGPKAITAREAEVLTWVASGKTAAEIAEITGLSQRTVNQHCENAQKRMGTNNRLHTVVEAIRHKLIML